MSTHLTVRMIELRAVLAAGGPETEAEQERLAFRATEWIEEPEEAAAFRDRLIEAIEYHHLLASMNGAQPGSCREGLEILNEIEKTIRCIG